MYAKAKVAVINGALRKHSNNAGLSRAVLTSKPHNIDLIFLNIHDIPLMNEDLEIPHTSSKTIEIPAPVAKIRDIARHSNALLFTSPEYNGAITGPLKNAYDWLSRDYTAKGGTETSPVANKKLGIIGASYISENSLKDVRQMVSYCKMNVFPETYYTKLGKSFDKEGNLQHQQERERLAQWCHGFFTWVLESGKL